MKKKINVSIIIPNFNGRDLLEKHLPAVIEATRHMSLAACQIIVVDDASTDDSVQFIKQLTGSRVKELKSLKRNNKLVNALMNNKIIIELIEKEKNEGFSSTVDLGVREAKGEIVVLLNTDVKPELDFLLPLIPHFADPEVFAVGTMDKSVEKGKIVLRGRGMGEFKRGFLIHRRGEINGKHTLWASGGSSAFKREAWLKLGGFDRIYDPFYGEDLDLGYRAWKAGYKVLFEPKSKVWHFHEKGVIKKSFPEFYKKAVAFRNQILFVLKNITDSKMLTSFFLFFPYHLLKTALRLDFSFWLGTLMVITKVPQAIKGRIEVKKLFVLSDREVFAKFG